MLCFHKKVSKQPEFQADFKMIFCTFSGTMPGFTGSTMSPGISQLLQMSFQCVNREGKQQYQVCLQTREVGLKWSLAVGVGVFCLARGLQNDFDKVSF